MVCYLNNLFSYHNRLISNNHFYPNFRNLMNILELSLSLGHVQLSKFLFNTLYSWPTLGLMLDWHCLSLTWACLIIYGNIIYHFDVWCYSLVYISRLILLVKKDELFDFFFLFFFYFKRMELAPNYIKQIWENLIPKQSLWRVKEIFVRGDL